MGVSEVKTAAGQCQVVTRNLQRMPLRQQVSIYDSRGRHTNAYYPDFAYRVDVKRKCLLVLSVVGPERFVQGRKVESASCFKELQKEGDALCIEEYGKKLGFVYKASSSTFFFTAIFECKQSEDVKWVNPLPFDAGAEDLVMSLARHASEMIAYFHRNISKLHQAESKHTRLSLVLQLDMINCETWKHASKMPLEVRFQNSADYAQQGPSKKQKQKGVRYRHDRQKWIAEYNPPGKKNHKISLGEYDNPEEAARAADAGIFIYANKRTAYNFDDSPCYLQQSPKPVKEDKEAVRKWARDFAKQSRLMITDSIITDSIITGPAMTTTTTTTNSSWSDGDGTSESMMQLQHCNSSISVSNIPPFLAALENYSLDSPDSSSFSLEEVTDNYYPETTTPLTIQDIDQVDDLATMSSVDLPVQINSNPPPLDFADDSFFRTNDPFWDPSPQSPLIRTVSDPRTSLLQDDIFQWYYPPPPPTSSSPSIQLIR